MKNVKLDTANRRSKIRYYANVSCDHDFVGSWRLVTFIRESKTSHAITDTSDIVEISESDDEDSHSRGHGLVCKYSSILKKIYGIFFNSK